VNTIITKNDTEKQFKSIINILLKITKLLLA